VIASGPRAGLRRAAAASACPVGSHPSSRPLSRLFKRDTAPGFTLIEVLVAVLVLALALTAIISAGSRYADHAASLRDRMLALWVAHNRMTEIQLLPVWPTIGKSDDTVEMGGTRWRWLVEVKETPDEHLRRIELRVVKDADKDRQYAYATLTSFIADVGRQTSQ
jgi:general secretion pathway protein I